MSPLRISHYEGTPGAAGIVAEVGHVTFAYAPQGGVSVAEGGAMLGADEGAFVEPGARVSGGGLAWIYEVAPADAPFLGGLGLIRSAQLSLDFAAPYLVRADRIESRSGDATPRHGHRGPGIRRLVFGRILAEIGEHTERIDAGMSWFETGHDMVVGTNIGEGNAAFVRMMVLPAELQGGLTSFMAADAAEAQKPRRVTSRLFGEVMMPAADDAAA